MNRRSRDARAAHPSRFGAADLMLSPPASYASQHPILDCDNGLSCRHNSRPGPVRMSIWRWAAHATRPPHLTCELSHLNALVCLHCTCNLRLPGVVSGDKNLGIGLRIRSSEQAHLHDCARWSASKHNDLTVEIDQRLTALSRHDVCSADYAGATSFTEGATHNVAAGSVGIVVGRQCGTRNHDIAIIKQHDCGAQAAALIPTIRTVAQQGAVTAWSSILRNGNADGATVALTSRHCYVVLSAALTCHLLRSKITGNLRVVRDHLYLLHCQ